MINEAMRAAPSATAMCERAIDAKRCLGGSVRKEAGKRRTGRDEVLVRYCWHQKLRVPDV